MGDWRAELRSRGYRLTPQRELVLEAVSQLRHATPEEVLARVRDTSDGVNISTVYRALELLEDLGLVAHAHLSHGAPTYHATTFPEHAHLVCRTCESVVEVEPETFASVVARLEDEHGFETDIRHLTVFGRCRDCRAADEC